MQTKLKTLQGKIDNLQDELNAIKAEQRHLKAGGHQFERLINDALIDTNCKVCGLYLTLYTPLQLVGDSPLDRLGYAIFDNLKNTQALVIDRWFDRLEQEVEDGYYPSLFAAFKVHAYGLHNIPSKFNDDSTREELRRYFVSCVFSNMFAYAVNGMGAEETN